MSFELFYAELIRPYCKKCGTLRRELTSEEIPLDAREVFNKLAAMDESENVVKSKVYQCQNCNEISFSSAPVSH